MSADAILMPVCSSAFDRESASECYAELMTLPRVASGRCKVALVGMRLDARTSAGGLLEAWAAQHKFPYVGALRETQAYVRSVEQGLTLFDLPASKVQADLAQWQPIVDWVHEAWQASERPDGMKRTVAQRATESVMRPAKASAVVLEPRVVRDVPQRTARFSLADHFGRLFAVFRP